MTKLRLDYSLLILRLMVGRISGIHADVAETKHEHWSSLAPDPMEVVLSAGQKARDGNLSGRPSWCAILASGYFRGFFFLLFICCFHL